MPPTEYAQWAVSCRSLSLRLQPPLCPCPRLCPRSRLHPLPRCMICMHRNAAPCPLACLAQTQFEMVPEPLTLSEKEEFMKTLTGVSLASDAFFPFRDSIDVASTRGVSYVVAAGGSVHTFLPSRPSAALFLVVDAGALVPATLATRPIPGPCPPSYPCLCAPFFTGCGRRGRPGSQRVWHDDGVLRAAPLPPLGGVVSTRGYSAGNCAAGRRARAVQCVARGIRRDANASHVPRHREFHRSSLKGRQTSLHVRGGSMTGTHALYGLDREAHYSWAAHSRDLKLDLQAAYGWSHAGSRTYRYL